jgi:hypothetical protein
MNTISTVLDLLKRQAELEEVNRPVEALRPQDIRGLA